MDTVESSRYPMMVMSAVQAALEKAGTFISMISSASFKSSTPASAPAPGSVSSESSSGNAKKKSRGGAIEKAGKGKEIEEVPSSSQDGDTARAVSRLLESLNKLQDLINEVAQHVNDTDRDCNSHSDRDRDRGREQAHRPSSGNNRSSLLVFSALHTLGDYFLHPPHHTSSRIKCNHSLAITDNYLPMSQVSSVFLSVYLSICLSA